MTNTLARLEWHDGQPFSSDYGDIYFSRENGLEETRHVFLQHNQLDTRWRHLASPHFTIGETGFGTGLNFLCAWQLWRNIAPAGARLHFVSTEKHPLSHQDLAAALSLWPELQPFIAPFLAQYRWLSPGMHRLVFDQGRVTLTLMIGDAAAMLAQLKASIDAWFLDGFAPSKNPDMWQPSLFASMAALSHAETTFSTFTSAGIVRRGLQTAGFIVDKVSGHGRKREMLAGRYHGHVTKEVIGAGHPGHALLIGGGIAGTATARAFAERGWQVTLLERHGDVALEASGNPAGILYPRLAGQDIALSRLALHGYLHTLRWLGQLGLPADAFDTCGLLQLGFDERELARIHAIAQRQLPDDIVALVDAHTASNIAGLAIRHPALHFTSAGWVRPAAICQALATHPNIQIVKADITELRRDKGVWQAWQDTKQCAKGTIAIIATANESTRFPQTRHLSLHSVRGQITMLPATAKNSLKTVVCTDGYISPPIGNMHCLGATFDEEDHDPLVRLDDHQKNLDMLQRSLPDLYPTLPDHNLLEGRVAFRAASPDYLPMAGPVLDSDILQQRPPRHTALPETLPWLEGLYVNTGHGSKGLINAPYCAELLASAVNGEPIPADRSLLAALDPNRFTLRQLGLKRLALGLACHPS